MSDDYAGNTLAHARLVNTALESQTFHDRVDAFDPNDYYRFSLTSSASLTLSLQDLGADANLHLLNAQGGAIAASTNGGASADLITATLLPGTYYIRVTPSQTNATEYSLNLDVQTNAAIDLVWRNVSAGKTSIWNMAGATNTAYADDFTLADVPAPWELEAMADFNADGTLDVLWRSYGDGATGIWYMQPDDPAVIHSVEVLPSVGIEWHIEGVADFNHDSKLDIIWRNYMTGESGLWFMQGDKSTTIASAALFAPGIVSPEWSIVGAADYNQDGAIDLVWQNHRTGDNGFWFMDPTNPLKLVSSSLFSPRGTNWSIEGVADFNRDGLADFLWRDYATGNTEVWILGRQPDFFVQSTIALTTRTPDWVVFPIVGSAPLPQIDWAGNTDSTAFDLGSLGTAVYHGEVGGLDTNDYYHFSVDTRSNFSLSMRGLTADADVELLAHDGTVLQRSAKPGVLAEAIATPLDAGTYLIRVNPYNRSTPYTLNLATTAIAPGAAIVSLTTPDAIALEVEQTTRPNPGQFTISRTGSTSTALTIHYTLSGTAIAGSDYTATQSIVIPAGRSSVTVPITVLDDQWSEAAETVVLSLKAGDAYQLGSATSGMVLIQDDDAARVGVPAFQGVSITDASGDNTAETVFQGGALQINYAFAQPNTTVATVELVAISMTTGNETVLETWTRSAVNQAIVNLAAFPDLAGGDYELFLLATTTTGVRLGSRPQQIKLLNWDATTTTGRYQGNNFSYTGAIGSGQVFVGRGGTDWINFGDLLHTSVVSLNGMALTDYDPFASTANQALFRGTAFDFLTLNDGREIYFQGIESLRFADAILDLTPAINDPHYGQQWNLHVTDVPGAWRFTQGSDKVLLVSWDSGIGGTVGQITDISAARLIADSASASDEPEFDENGNRDSGHGHTAISVMAATANNGQGVTGINWNSRVLVHDLYGQPDNREATSITIAQSIQSAMAIARQNGWKVVVQGGVQGYNWLNEPGADAIYRLIEQNTDIAFFAVAAGNGALDIDDRGKPDSDTFGGGVASLQTQYGNVMAVGALRPGSASNQWYDTGDGIVNVEGLTNARTVSLANYSNYGPSLTMVAPTDVPAMSRFNTLDYFGGTSAANPNMAAIASLVWSVNPNLNALQIRQLLMDTATDVGPQGRDDGFGEGVVNAEAAVRRATALNRNLALASLYDGRLEFS